MSPGTTSDELLVKLQDERSEGSVAKEDTATGPGSFIDVEDVMGGDASLLDSVSAVLEDLTSAGLPPSLAEKNGPCLTATCGVATSSSRAALVIGGWILAAAAAAVAIRSWRKRQDGFSSS